MLSEFRNRQTIIRISVISIFFMALLMGTFLVAGRATTQAGDPQARIVASTAGDWLWTTDFLQGPIDISIYETQESVEPLWSGIRETDAYGFVFVGFDDHHLNLVPGNYLVVSDGDNEKSLVLETITMEVFDTNLEVMAGTAPAGRQVTAAAGPQDWQERITVQADPTSGAWLADFKTVNFDIKEDYRGWSYAHIYDEDGDANEADAPPQLPSTWRDDFNGNTLTPGWFWKNGDSGEWNISDGHLELIASNSSTPDGNLLLRQIQQGDFSIETSLSFTPVANFQFAGLVIYQDGNNFLQLGRAFCDVEGTCVGDGLYFDQIADGNIVDGNFATPSGDTPEISLRLERRGDMVRGFYSRDGGMTWYEIGTQWIPSDFQVSGVGLVASQDFSEVNISASFDYFELTLGTYIVNTTDDNDDGFCDVIHCSLREALNAANSSSSDDLINFNIPGEPPYTIQPQSPFPGIDDPVTIDGATQPGFEAGPIIELDGSVAGEGTNGLSINASNSTVRGLLIDRFSGSGIAIGNSMNNVIEANVLSGNGGSGVSIAGETATGNIVRGNLIGINPNGTEAWPNTDGIWLGDNTNNNTIGGTTAEERNIISGNAVYGISSNSGASQNQIMGNYLGTDPTGSLPVGNGGGILLGSGSNNNLVGGTQAGAGNLISGNWWDGLVIGDPGSNGNVVQGNFIGTDSSGVAPVPEVGAYTLEVMPETVATYPAGTNIDGFVSQSDNPLAPWFRKSVTFQGTGVCGCEGSSCPSMLIYRYKLEFAVDTALTSVTVSGAAFNGPDSGLSVLDEVGVLVGETNTYGGNSFQTIYLKLTDVVGKVFYIEEYDTSCAWRYRQSIVINGPAPIGNHGHGLIISAGATGNLIGGAEPAARNIISGNFGGGVGVFNPGTTGNTVQGNYIGADVTGMHALPNHLIGVHLADQASNNLFSSNLISSNLNDGMTISSPGNTVQGNLIGTDASGNSAMPNGLGVWIGEGGDNTLVGGTKPGQGNLISGNTFGGVSINQPQTTGVRVLGNYIGTNRNGDTALPNGGDGVYIGANQSVIGGPDPGAGNLISGNTASGIAIRDGAMRNIVQGNHIGTDATGSTAMGQPGPTVGKPNVSIVFACPTYDIGTDIDGFVSQSSDPLAPWAGESVTFKGTSFCDSPESLGAAQLIYRYKLEFDETTQLTSVAVSGAAFNGPDNVLRVLDEHKIVVGMASTFGGNSFQTPYVILQGVEGKVFYIDEFDTSTHWRFRQSFIINGPVSLGNLGDGVLFATGATGNLVGGTDAGAGNLISGNRADGVGFFDPGTNGNWLKGNFIGTDATGSFALPNNGAGIWIGVGASNNIVGGDSPARNVISGNNGDAVSINNAETTGNEIQHNYIGTDASGSGPLPNLSNGVVLVGGTNNNLIADNLISANGGSGVVISDPGTSHNTLQGNFIGTDANGAFALPNNGVGVWIGAGASNNIIGGTSPKARNVISGNNGDGISINNAETTGNEIRRNYIGTNASGNGPIANLSNGVVLVTGTNDNLIAHNLISANGGDGVAIYDPGTSRNKVQANYIGTDVTGMLALGNAVRGVLVANGASANLITGNLISSNGAAGLRLTDSGTEMNKVQGNLIGTDITGKGQLGNAYFGVRITDGAANNLIGGTDPGDGNTIAFNAYHGISLNLGAGSGNSFLANSIFSNGGLGIDLNEDGVTLNDPGDIDSGSNGLQNFPVLNGFTKVRGGLTVAGSLNSLPNSAYRIEFFSVAICDLSGYGEGNQYLGFINVRTNASGSAVFSFTLPKNFPLNACVTSTATDSYGSTSEFSKCILPTR